MQKRRYSPLISTLDNDAISAARVHSLTQQHISTTTNGGGTTAEESQVSISIPSWRRPTDDSNLTTTLN